ncbi:BMC domain-containing protein [bacterium]|nr:BMC domain-containing protein [bacterium]
MLPTIGFLELNSIAKGIEALDAMLKAAEVELLFARPVCAGKFVILLSGKVGAVKVSMKHGDAIGAASVVDKIVIPNIHPDLIPAISGTTEVDKLDALGIIETFTVASSIMAADAAAKAGEVKLIEIRIAYGLGGKSFVTFTGKVGSVESALKAGCQYAEEKGLLVQKTVIPRPIPGMRELII